MNNRRQIPDCYDYVGPGWRKILEDLHAQLSKLEPKYSVDQLKEKFGGLRVYLTGDYREDLEELIDAAAEQAEKTCEHCGSIVEVTIHAKSGFWVKARCREH